MLHQIVAEQGLGFYGGDVFKRVKFLKEVVVFFPRPVSTPSSGLVDPASNARGPECRRY